MKRQHIAAMSRLSRRAFVQGAGVAGLGLLAGCAVVTLPTMPPGRPAVVALLMVDTPPPAVTLDVFRQGLAERGWALGHNLVLAERSAEGHDERLPDLAAELLALPSDVLVTVGTPATLAAWQGTATVPIVFATGANPIAHGMAESYQRPGRNVTGITVLSAELTAKRIQLLTTVAPSVSRVAVFWREPAARDEAQRAASLLGVQCDFFAVPDQQALASALDAAVKAGAEAILVEPQPLMLTAGPQIAAFAATRRLPVISGNSGLPRTGALMSYGPRVPDNFRRAAYYVDRILKGAQPADLPVEQPREFDFVINLKTAQALGLTIPQQVLLQATEVIQ